MVKNFGTGEERFGSTLDLRDDILLWHPRDVLEHPLAYRGQT